MGKYNFDEVIDRHNTGSMKYDFQMEQMHRNDLIPLWVADMDFKLPNQIIDDIKNTIDHGIFGYTDSDESYFNAVHNWFFNNFKWDTKKEWLVKTPGVVFAVSNAIRSYTNEGDAVIIQQPVYYPFANSIKLNNRKLVNSELIYKDGYYSIDFEDFEKKIVSENVKLFILCSPHNPVGRVWTFEELKHLANICLKHKVIIVSDEIHCDFTYPGHTHTVLATIDNDIAMNSIICTAPSKTFNLAGLQCSNIFIPDDKLRQKFEHSMAVTGTHSINIAGISACRSAYNNGREWLDQLKKYLEGNLSYVRDFLKENIPQIKLVEPEGTYLIWLDCTELNLTHEQLQDLVIDKAHLWLDAGSMFGNNSELFERINLTCPKSLLKKAMNNLKNAVSTIHSI